MDKTKSKPSSKTKAYQDEEEDSNEKNGTAIESKSKKPRLSEPNGKLTFNSKFLQLSCTKWLRNAWQGKHGKQDAKDALSGAQIYNEPFQIALLPELLHTPEACQELVNEMVDNVHWSRKQMDMYEFYQSTDLSNMSDCRLLTNFLQLLRREVRPWMEEVTGLKLDYVSASCSMYTCGDYLLVHDDLLKDRQVAFIYYLSPWQGAKEWSETQGGCLELFNSDTQYFPQFPVARKISPKNNQFVFFKVGARSFHQVGEVTNYDYPRLTINGWFHGATNEESSAADARPFTRLNFKQPNISAKPNLTTWLNEVYLKPQTRKRIQKRIEDNSEICLYEFLKPEAFENSLLLLLRDDTLKWHRQGPANAQNYEVLEVPSASRPINDLLTLFSSNEMFELLRDYTDLDLYGSLAITPTCSVEVQRWSHGNYTMLGDGAICEDNTLDLIFYLNATEGAAVITYLSPESEEPTKAADNLASDDGDSDAQDANDEQDESVLLTITPVDNALNIVYRCEGTTKFTKYVSHNTSMDKGPVFVISCSYKE